MGVELAVFAEFAAATGVPFNRDSQGRFVARERWGGDRDAVLRLVAEVAPKPVLAAASPATGQHRPHPET